MKIIIPVIQTLHQGWIDSYLTSVEYGFLANSCRLQKKKPNAQRLNLLKEYIQKEEFFFSSIVLGIIPYSGDIGNLNFEFKPLTNGDDRGHLEINQSFYCCVLDGNSRVAAIVDSVEENPQLSQEKIPCIFVIPQSQVEIDRLISDLSKKVFVTDNKPQPISFRPRRR
ncbi:MAG: DNA sulfur modification protein DndB [Limnoraphis sp.]